MMNEFCVVARGRHGLIFWTTRRDKYRFTAARAAVVCRYVSRLWPEDGFMVLPYEDAAALHAAIGLGLENPGNPPLHDASQAVRLSGLAT